jgi:GNAT superfamily N-acetyltransferase
MELRRARVDDARELTRIAYAAKASWGYPEAWLDAWSPVLTITADDLRAHFVLVAEVGGAPVGFAALEDGEGGAEVGHLWVLPERQGLGAGRALLRGILDEARARGCGAVRVESDPNARAFYEHMGATLVGEVAAPVLGNERRLPVLRLRVGEPG